MSYADDSAILEGADTRNMFEHKINGCVENFREICDNLRLNLSASKSIAMRFGRNTMKNRYPIFKLMGNTISVKEAITYLVPIWISFEIRFRTLQLI